MAMSAEFEETLQTWTPSLRGMDAADMLRGDVLDVYRRRSTHRQRACAACGRGDECDALPAATPAALAELQPKLHEEYGFISKYLETDADEGRRLLEARRPRC